MDCIEVYPINADYTLEQLLEFEGFSISFQAIKEDFHSLHRKERKMKIIHKYIYYFLGMSVVCTLLCPVFLFFEYNVFISLWSFWLFFIIALLLGIYHKNLSFENSVTN